MENSTLELLLDRKYKKETYTVGDLYVDGDWFCSTMEDKDRGLSQIMPLEEIKKIKVYAETAIPTGRYVVRMDIVSPKYNGVKWYIHKAMEGTRKGKESGKNDIPYSAVILQKV